MTGQEFLHLSADQLVSELKPNEAIRKFTRNPVIIGAYAEASLRQIITRAVAPLRVSTGGVISEQLCSVPNVVPQIDAMIWSPSPLPALFNVGDFGLVPRSSCFGIMEIKSSAYSGVGKKMAESLREDRVYNFVADIAKTLNAEHQPGEEMFLNTYPGIGVICLKQDNKKDEELDELIRKGIAVVLFHLIDGHLKTNAEAVHRLINFLTFTRLRANIMSGHDFVNVSLLRNQS